MTSPLAYQLNWDCWGQVTGKLPRQPTSRLRGRLLGSARRWTWHSACSGAKPRPCVMHAGGDVTLYHMLCAGTQSHAPMPYQLGAPELTCHFLKCESAEYTVTMHLSLCTCALSPGCSCVHLPNVKSFDKLHTTLSHSTPFEQCLNPVHGH